MMEPTGHRYWFDATINERGTTTTVTVPGDDHRQAAMWARMAVIGSSWCELVRDSTTQWNLVDTRTGWTEARIKLSRRRPQEAR